MKYLLLLALSPLLLFPTYDEEEISYLEEQIPELAVVALRTAYREALASGSCVLIVTEGMIVEVSPDGSERVIKELPNWTPVTSGEYLRICIEKERLNVSQ